jgi:hypothetical protein
MTKALLLSLLKNTQLQACPDTIEKISAGSKQASLITANIFNLSRMTNPGFPTQHDAGASAGAMQAGHLGDRPLFVSVLHAPRRRAYTFFWLTSRFWRWLACRLRVQNLPGLALIRRETPLFIEWGFFLPTTLCCRIQVEGGGARQSVIEVLCGWREKRTWKICPPLFRLHDYLYIISSIKTRFNQ